MSTQSVPRDERHLIDYSPDTWINCTGDQDNSCGDASDHFLGITQILQRFPEAVPVAAEFSRRLSVVTLTRAIRQFFGFRLWRCSLRTSASNTFRSKYRAKREE